MALTNITSAAAGNAGTGTAANMDAGDYVIQATGTFGGGTVSIEASYDGGTTWLATGLSFTAAGLKYLQTPAGKIRTNITGGSGGAITVGIDGTPSWTASANQITDLYNRGKGVLPSASVANS